MMERGRGRRWIFGGLVPAADCDCGLKMGVALEYASFRGVNGPPWSDSECTDAAGQFGKVAGLDRTQVALGAHMQPHRSVTDSGNHCASQSAPVC